MSSNITGSSLMRQYSLEANLVRKNTETGKDLREELPVTVVLPGEVQTCMKDLGGYEEAKVEVIEYVNFINHQERYKKLGARLPKGALLVGPPGTGKTLLARATAGEANIPFIACSSASLLLGSEGPNKLRKIFQLAYSMAPCVLFFDEIDCIGRARDHRLSKPETQCITEELLVQLDGFHQRPDKLLIILASTNRQDEMDEALLRPGRFDRIIVMPAPDLPSRAAVLNVHLVRLTTDIDKAFLAKRFSILTAGLTGAQIASLCNEAAMIAARDLNESIKMEHFEQAMDRVRSGIKKRKSLGPEDKRRAANHDAAHAIAGWFLKGASPPTKLCIMPNSSGEVECSQDKGTCFPPVGKDVAMNLMAVCLAGAAAEKLLSGEHCASCKEDFKAATELAWQFVTECGMSDKIGIANVRCQHLMWGDCGRKYVLGPNALNSTFEEVKKTLDDCMAIATKILTDKRSELEKVSELVMEKELVTLDMLVDVLGPSPHIDMDKLTLEDADFLPSGMKSWQTSE